MGKRSEWGLSVALDRASSGLPGSYGGPLMPRNLKSARNVPRRRPQISAPQRRHGRILCDEGGAGDLPGFAGRLDY